MASFPGKSDLIIHFAHAAYQFQDRFALRETGIQTFQTSTIEETRARIGEGDILVLSGFWRNDMLADAKKLKFIQACAAGFDNFDQAALKAAGVRLSNGSGINSNAVSEQAIGLTLAFTRLIHHARDNQRKHFWRGMIADLGKREDELPGKTMIVYGLGIIGQRTARLARAFGMHTIGIKRNLSSGADAVDELHGPEAFKSLLPRADFVVLCCPLTDETRNLMDAAAFAAMRPDAYLINVARGGCVDQDALIAALRGNQIAGAGIDVTVPEPLDADSPLWEFDNVILTPHSGGETRKYEDNVIDILLDNIDKLTAGESTLRNQIV